MLTQKQKSKMKLLLLITLEMMKISTRRWLLQLLGVRT